MRRRAAAVLLVLAAACGPSGDRVLVAAGTTLVDSGLLDAVVADYEAENPGVEVSVVGEATAQVLELGRRGGADLLITHAPAAEQAFVDEGRAARVVELLQSRFALVGPPGRVSDLDGLDPGAAFAAIAGQGWDFVTRADGSGTHEREREVWDLAGVAPDGEPWYVATGQGMGLTLQVADQRGAFTLAEEGSFLAAGDVVTLAAVDLAPSNLLANPYRAIVVEGGEEQEAAGAFVDWLLSSDGRAAIERANEELFGREIYSPGA